MTVAEKIIDLANAELKAARICRGWPNMVRSKEYQLRGVALYLLWRTVRQPKHYRFSPTQLLHYVEKCKAAWEESRVHGQ